MTSTVGGLNFMSEVVGIQMIRLPHQDCFFLGHLVDSEVLRSFD